MANKKPENQGNSSGQNKELSSLSGSGTTTKIRMQLATTGGGTSIHANSSSS